MSGAKGESINGFVASEWSDPSLMYATPADEAHMASGIASVSKRYLMAAAATILDW